MLLQAGALRPRQRPGRGRRGRRRPDRPLFRQPGRRQPSSGRTLGGGRFRNITEQAGVALAGRIGVDRLVRGHRQRRRPGSLRHHGPRRQRAVRERRPRPFQGHLESGRRRSRRPLLGRGVLRLRQRRPARPVSVQRRPVHQRQPPARTARSSAWSTPFRATCTPTAPRPRSSTGTSAATASRTSPRRCGLGDAGWSGDASVADLNGDGFARSLRAQHAGRRTTTSRTRAASAFVDRTAQLFPRTSVGRHGHQVLRLRQRRPARPVRHRHAFRHERGGRTGPRKAQVARWSGRRTSCRATRPDSSSATRSSTTSAAAGSKRSPTGWMPRTTGRGDRASAT